MLNQADVPATPLEGVVDYQDPVVAKHMAGGVMNVEETQVLANISASIRRGFPQMRTGPVRGDRICLVGSGPSLQETEDELRELLWGGAILVTMNGAYHWCRERNLRPNTQIVMDARPSNSRFVTPYTPKCNYVLASQCAPEVFDAVADYPDAWIFHAVLKSEGITSQLLDQYYGGQWIGVGGGTTVATRAIHLLRMAGYVRFDLFGIDCCWHGDQHHAMVQPENDGDKKTRITVGVRGEDKQTPFLCSPWHIKQFEDFMTIMKINGKHFRLAVHGKGMLAHVVRELGHADLDTIDFTKE